jgi:NAD(P)-dependent dehydrogenase (short-subunit alcohol dehydrogenase family)
MKQQMAANFLGHFYLTRCLLPLVLAAADKGRAEERELRHQQQPSPDAEHDWRQHAAPPPFVPRIVMLSSVLHQFATPAQGAISFPLLRDPDARVARSPLRRYAESKLAMLLLARELHQRLQGRGVCVNAVHPGTVSSGIQWGPAHGYGPWATPLVAALLAFGVSPAAGAQSTLWAAAHADVQRLGVSGAYIEPPCRRADGRVSEAGRDAELGATLWAWSDAVVDKVLIRRAKEVEPPEEREEEREEEEPGWERGGGKGRPRARAVSLEREG